MLTVRCFSADEMDTEKSFYLPSSFVCNITGISFGDGFEYRSDDGDVIASFISNGENWGTQQEALLVDRDIFLKALNARKLKPFWIFRVYKSPSNKAYERYPEILHDTDTSYIVWLEENNFKFTVLNDIEPPKREGSSDALKELNKILNQLEYTFDGKNEKYEQIPCYHPLREYEIQRCLYGSAEAAYIGRQYCDQRRSVWPFR